MDGPHPRPPRVRGRPRTYGEEVLGPLKKIWATLNGPCGKRLAPFMGEMVEVMERCGELRLTPEVRAKLLSSPRRPSTGSSPPSAAGSR